MTERNYGRSLHEEGFGSGRCPDCGAMVWDKERHDAFHDQIGRLTMDVYVRKPKTTPRIKAHAEELARERGEE